LFQVFVCHKEGKIEKVITGYYAGVFEDESASILASLLDM
jgi:hypothetical protein